MTSECNACYLRSTEPRWLAELVVRNRADRPCEMHAELMALNHRVSAQIDGWVRDSMLRANDAMETATRETIIAWLRAHGYTVTPPEEGRAEQ